MLAKSKTRRAKLAIAYSNPLLQRSSLSSRSDSNATGVPKVPAMPDSLLLLQVLLSGPVVNLDAAAEAIRNDVGLTVQVLGRACSRHGVDELNISKSVVLLGIGSLRALSGRMAIISEHPKGRTGVQACERFWAHARLTALMAQELARKDGGVQTEQAYLAGLLYRIGELPAVLGWDDSGLPRGCAGDRDYALASLWNLPSTLREVLRADQQPGSQETRDLLKVVKLADQQASHIEGLVSQYARGVF